MNTSKTTIRSADVEAMAETLILGAQAVSVLESEVAALKAECARLKSDNIAHGGVNLLLARQNADLRDVLSDIVTEAGIPASLESRVTELLDLYAKPHAWYREYRAEVEREHARASLVRAVEPICAVMSRAACGSEVARG